MLQGSQALGRDPTGSSIRVSLHLSLPRGLDPATQRLATQLERFVRLWAASPWH